MPHIQLALSAHPTSQYPGALDLRIFCLLEPPKRNSYIMRASFLIAISAFAGYVTAASLPLGERADEDCTVAGEYCCTWEGCKDCCGECDLRIDSAQGYCLFDFW